MAGRLDGDQRTEAARLAFAAIPDIRGAPHLHANAVRDLGPYVPEDLAVEVWNYVISLEDEPSTYGGAALAAVAPQFGAETVEASMEAITGSLPGDDLISALAGLVPKLEGGARESALATAIKTTLEGERVEREKAAVKLAPYLDGAHRESVLSRGLQAARDYGNDEMAAGGLIALLPHLDTEERVLARTDAAARALRVREPRRRAELILQALNDGAVAPPDSTDPAILACFARQTPDLVPRVRTLLLNRLSELKGRPRTEMLELIAQPALFAQPILTSDGVATAVHQICRTWSWV